MNYLIEPASQNGATQMKSNTVLLPIVMLLILLMGSSFLAGMTWSEYPAFTAFPALLGITVIGMAKSV